MIASGKYEHLTVLLLRKDSRLYKQLKAVTVKTVTSISDS